MIAEKLYNYYKTYIKSPHSKKQRAIKNIKNLLKERVPVRFFYISIQNYYKYIEKNKIDKKYRIACQNFFGRERIYKDYLISKKEKSINISLPEVSKSDTIGKKEIEELENLL